MLNAAEEFLSFGCVRTKHRLVSAYINRIINVAWCFGHGILLDPEANILCPFQSVLQGGNCEKAGQIRSALQVIFSFEPRGDLLDHLAAIGVVY
jgi:hypothetical protein